MRVAFVPDLMDRSKLGGIEGLAFLSSLDALAMLDRLGAGDTVVIDLGRPGALEAAGRAASTGARVIGFASHVDSETIDAARAGGVETMARSAFFSRVADLLA